MEAEVAVIGGGVVGASIAWHLAKLGVRDIVIIDRAAGPGAGSTGKATGGFRAQFATPINVRLSLNARDQLLRFEEDTGVDPGYQQVGYLWIAFTDSDLEGLRKSRSVQHQEGLHEAREISTDDIARLNPVISADGAIGGAFCPTDGYIRPLEILRGYLEAAQRLGVRTIWNAHCAGLNVDSNGRIKSVRVADDNIEVKYVVNAAGPWAARVASMAGVDLPVQPLKRQAAFTEPLDSIPPTIPMTIFMDDGFHLRARDGRALLCWPNPEPLGEPQNLEADDGWIESVTQMGKRRVPVLREVKIERDLCYAGLYEMSPDDHAIIGLSPKCDNMFFANGSSGHGVMHSPAIGSIVADMIAGREPEIDVSMLRPSRFDEGEAIKANELL